MASPRDKEEPDTIKAPEEPDLCEIRDDLNSAAPQTLKNQMIE